MWTVGLAVSGNGIRRNMGRLSDNVRRGDVAVRREHAASKLYAAGLHYVVVTLAVTG